MLCIASDWLEVTYIDMRTDSGYSLFSDHDLVKHISNALQALSFYSQLPMSFSTHRIKISGETHALEVIFRGSSRRPLRMIFPLFHCDDNNL